MDQNVIEWCGLDGTCILATPMNILVFHPPVVTHDMDWLWSKAGREKLKELKHLGMPLAIKWVERRTWKYQPCRRYSYGESGRDGSRRIQPA